MKIGFLNKTIASNKFEFVGWTNKGVLTSVNTEKKGNNIKTSTNHEYYSEFEIDNLVFRCKGDYHFLSGDEIALYAINQKNGIYEVYACKNFTREFMKKANWFLPLIGLSVGLFFIFIFLVIIIADINRSPNLALFLFFTIAGISLFYWHDYCYKNYTRINKELCNLKEI